MSRIRSKLGPKYLGLQKGDPIRIRKERGTRLCLIAIGAVVLIAVGGAFFAKATGLSRGTYAEKAALFCMIIAWTISLAEIGISALFAKRFRKKLKNRRIADIVQTYLRQRELAEDAVKKSLVTLRRLRVFSGILAGSFIFLAALGAFCYGILRFINSATISTSFFLFIAAAVAVIGGSRIRLPVPPLPDDRTNGYVYPEEFHTLYALAKRAAKARGCKKDIRIRLLPGCEIGIAVYRDVVVLLLGVRMLSILSEEELYAILLHEFEHPAQENEENRFAAWLLNGQSSCFLEFLYRAAFGYVYDVYLYHFNLYEYASAILIEAAADRAVAEECDKAVAASSLLKSYFCERALWEEGAFDWSPPYATADISGSEVCKSIEAFVARIELRSSFWLSFLPREILSHGATHPTTISRLNALGVTDYRILPKDSSPDFESERSKALVRVADVIVHLNRADYARKREAYYLKPLACVEEWKAAGMPLTPDGYGDIIDALRTTGKIEEALALCDRAIAELPDAAALQAMMTKGCILLHRLDPAGIPLVWHAMENNKNFIDAAIGELGNYFCSVGDREGLERYRAAALELRQKQADFYGEIDVLKKGDRLSAEHLPEGEAEDALAHILEAGGEQVEQVYLIRKTIGDELSVSAFILRLARDCPVEKSAEIFHKTFRYLDTVSHRQYALFDYRHVEKAGFQKIKGALVYDKAKRDKERKATAKANP